MTFARPTVTELSKKDLFDRVVALEARILTLEAALTRYGRHDRTCDTHFRTSGGHACDCGLEAVPR